MSSNVSWWIRDLQKFKSDVSSLHYEERYSAPHTPRWSRFITPSSIQNILSAAACCSVGRDLFKAADAPNIPVIPTKPSELSERNSQSQGNFISKLFGRPSIPDPREIEAFQLWNLCNEIARKKLQELNDDMLTSQKRFERELNEILEGKIGKSDYLRKIIHYSDCEAILTGDFRGAMELYYEEKKRLLQLSITIPNFEKIEIFKDEFGGRAGKLVSARDRKALIERLFYSLPIRMAYLACKSDFLNAFDMICVNATQSWTNKSTGQTVHGVVSSFQSTKDQIENLVLSDLDPRLCFLSFKGIKTPDIFNTAPIRPIFEFNTKDSRIVESNAVERGEEDSNLASMEWEDFEHLVRQIFELEFGKDGIEVKVTQASRDRGVDAIMFDPDPIRGGKYIIQAKRYTRTVSVADVRELYGTILNEGANRGILVTTSSYGSDAYDFAKGKPISLIDGSHLLSILKKHGYLYRIDLREARDAFRG